MVFALYCYFFGSNIKKKGEEEEEEKYRCAGSYRKQVIWKHHIYGNENENYFYILLGNPHNQGGNYTGTLF